MSCEANKQGVTITKEIIDGLMDTIRKLYLCDDIPWVIGYSGGKDSTATLQLVWLALSELPKDQLKKQVHIINTDTMVESPVISKWVQTSLKTMDDAAEEQGLPFVTHRLTPTIDNTFWVNFIGRGYPFPRKKLRWCTDRLKIQPVNNFVKEKIAEHGEIIMVIGTRKAESARRAKTMAYYEKKRVRELLSPKLELATPKREDLSVYREILRREFEEDTCFYCGKKLQKVIHVDHFIPWSFVKDDKIWNFVLSCPTCNEKKNNRVPGKDYLIRIEDRNKKIQLLNNTVIQTDFAGYSDDLIGRMWSYAKLSGIKEYRG